jgi:crossover junction endodeoxyribonuclease RusA
MLLPYPISTNLYWRRVGNSIVVSKHAQAYKRYAALTAQLSKQKLHSGDVHIIVIVHPKTNKDGTPSKVLLDLDNCLKVIFDALNGVSYHDDKQIKKIWAEYGEPMKSGGVTVHVRAML